MNLVINERMEQGTRRGVMKFGRGSYPVEVQDDGQFLVTHEPRPSKQGPVTQTIVEKWVIEKMVALGVAKLED